MNILLLPTVEPCSGPGPVGRLLLQGLVNLAQALCGTTVEIMVPVRGRYAFHRLTSPASEDRDQAHLLAFDQVAAEALSQGSASLFFFNPTFLLLEYPQYESVAQPTPDGRPVIGGFPHSRELHTFACSPDWLKRHSEEAGKVIGPLCVTLEDTDTGSWPALGTFQTVISSYSCPDYSPALSGVGNPRGTASFDSPLFLNTALREALALSLPIDIRQPLSLRNAFLALRSRSSVPWIFNSLANEVELRLGEAQPLSLPPELHIAVAGMCNLNCKFCDYSPDIARKVFVTPDQVRRLDVLPDLLALRLTSGFGEPTTNPDLAALIELARRGNPQLEINFFSNGLLLGSRKLRESMLDFSLNWVNISLNASSPATWNYLHGFDGFNKVVENLRNLHQEKVARQSLHPLVFASMVLTRSSLQELPRMPGLCRELGIDRFTAFPFFGLATNSRGKFGSEEAYHLEREQYPEIYERTVLEAERHRISLEIPSPPGQDSPVFGVEQRPLRNFARIERNFWRLGKLLAAVDELPESNSHCPFLWRRANIGSVDRTHGSVVETHCLYPCDGPLSPLNFTRVACVDFSDSQQFRAAWRNHLFALLREAQHAHGICQVCDACRNLDTRDPQFASFLRRLIGEFAQAFRLRRVSPSTTGGPSSGLMVE